MQVGRSAGLVVRVKEAMLEYGFDVHIVPDGQIHRFRGPSDKRPNGWYVCHGDHGAFGSWKTGLTVPWCDRSQTDSREYRKLIEQEHRERRQSEILKHSERATEARSIWANAEPAIEHPYLKCKQVSPWGIRIKGDHLVVPMTIDRKVLSIQYIHSDGFKNFMRGGRVKGCYYPLGSLEKRIWIAEGFATAATVHEVTGETAVCAFTAGNLADVTEHFAAMGLRVFVAADNDEAGIDAAHKSLDAGAEFASWPEPEKADWNDYGVTHGAETMHEALYGA